MRFLTSLSAVAGILAPLALAAISDSQLTVYAWPVSAATPVSLAEIKLSSAASTPSSSSSDYPLSATLLKYTPPSITLSKDQLVRIGLYDVSTQEWIGSGTSALSFAPGYDRKILLHLDESGKVFHVGFTAMAAQLAGAKEEKTKSGKKSSKNVQEVKGETTVEIVLSSPAPQPELNKPVVLSPEGKAEGQEEDNRSFLQK
jgi:hypothetical protein